MRRTILLTLVVLLAVAPAPASAATCSDHATQAEAQRAADTRDGDGDGVFCEALPCPCLRPGQAAGTSPERDERRREPAGALDPPGCLRTARVQPISFSGTRYPHVREHARQAMAAGWPRTLVLHRRRADARRQRVIDQLPRRRGFDRDEYPPAVGRSRPAASVAYVPSAENRSHGAALGAKLRRFCSGQRFRYVFF